VHKIITLRHDDTSVAFDTTAATWSLTDLGRAAGSPENREPWNWARFEGKRYLETLAATLPVTWSPENPSETPFEREPRVTRDGSDQPHSQVESDLCVAQVEREAAHSRFGLITTRRGGAGGGGGTWGRQ
jgi:hypothetical protein